MTEQYWTPGEPWPDPHAPSGPTRWDSPAEDYAPPADGAWSWGAPDPPGQVPPPLAGTDVGYRVGWLTRGRDAGPDDAA